MPDAYVIDALRTPVGRYNGVLASVRPDDLVAIAIAAAVARNELPADDIADVYMGATNQAGEDNRNIARMGSLLAGLPVEIPGVTVNRLCASGLEAINQASRAVRTGDGDLLLAGGVESMTRAPLATPKPERAFERGDRVTYDTTIGWRFPNPRMKKLGYTDSMGQTAENVAERYGITRDQQDEFALESHRRALAAVKAGRFDDEIVAVGDVAADEGPRADSSLEKLAKLPAAFREGGTVTAGNSSTLNDGAACVVIGTEERARSLGKQPLLRIVSVGTAGVHPAYMGVGPVPASRQALDRAGLSIEDIGLVELNEAFAAQVLACMDELGIDREKLNVNGGAIALGHPLGCSGAKILTTLAWEMRRRNVRYGLCTMCIGVGQGVATVVENPAAA